MNTEESAAIVAFEVRVKRLEELEALWKAGELSEKILAAAIDTAEQETEEDRHLFYDIFKRALGPLDLIKYAEYEAKLETLLEGLQDLRELYYEDLVTAEQWLEGLANVCALWRFLAPWRDEITKAFEGTEEAIEAERQAALKGAGYKIPTERKTKPKLTEEQDAIARLRALRRRGNRG